MIAFSASTLRAEDAKPEVKKIAVEIKVVEVYMDKLKKLGFDWQQLKADGTSEKKSLDDLISSATKEPNGAKQFAGFLEALRQNSLACNLAAPTIVTLDGRSASLALGTNEIDIVPIVLGSGKIRLECRIQLYPAQAAPNGKLTRNAGAARFCFDSAVELDPGKTTLVGHTRTHQSFDGKPQETEFLIFATADLFTGAQPPPAGISTTTTARDIELKR
jgi:hypothetical protein